MYVRSKCDKSSDNISECGNKNILPIFLVQTTFKQFKAAVTCKEQFIHFSSNYFQTILLAEKENNVVLIFNPVLTHFKCPNYNVFKTQNMRHYSSE